MKSHTNSRKTRMMSVGLATVALVCSTIMIGTSAGSRRCTSTSQGPDRDEGGSSSGDGHHTHRADLADPAWRGTTARAGRARVDAQYVHFCVERHAVVGFIGTPMTIAGAGLPANTSVQIQWPRPTQRGRGRRPVDRQLPRANYTKINVILDTVTTSATGAFSVSIDTPRTSAASTASMRWSAPRS